ncbi:MAG TPA: DUF5808 domain-containing protein [Terriglobia bacterium]|nr:DUF5808 domain-containing protein [Terriglobia bacterium]
MSALTSVVLPFVVLVVLVGGMLFWLPRLTRPDLYFAVTVPPDFRDSAEGRAIFDRYRTVTLLCSLVALALVLVASGHWPLVLVAALGIQEGGSLAAYIACRRRVLPHAVAPVAVREAPLRPRSAHLPGGWKLQAGPFVLLGGAGLYLHQRWADIPPRFPIHWDLHSQPNGWAFRTPAGIYGPLIEGTLVCLMMAGLAYALLRWTRPVRIGGAGGNAESHFRRTVALLLIAVEYLIGLMFAGVSLLALKPGPPPVAAMIALPLAFAALVLIVLVRQGQGGSRRVQAGDAAAVTPAGGQPAVEGGAGARPVGDRTADRYWKGGLIYVNPDDPALFIEKRFGVGYTVNFGRPASWVILGLIILVPVIVGLVIKLGTS